MFYNKFLEFFLLPMGDILFGSNYIKSLKKSREYNSLSSEELSDIQSKKLKNILEFAKENCSLYKDLELKGSNPIEWLQQFPILDKTLLKTHTDSLLTRKKNKLIKFNSSGSSGIQATIYMSKSEVSQLQGILTNWWELAGYKLGNPIIQTGITPNRRFVKKIKDIFLRTTYFSAFNTTEEEVLKLLKKASESNNKYILIGYASSINFFATVSLNNNINVTFKSIISLGDKLFRHYRMNLEKAFKCKVYDTYGSSEGFMIATQYDLEHLYIYAPQVYVEILNDDYQPVNDGEMGNIIVTRLDGYSMPLIRYKIGDLGIKLPIEEYPKIKKLNFPLLKQIVGRDTDIVRTKENEILNVHFFTGIFEYYAEIKQFRIVQKSINAITIEIIKEEKYTNKISIEIERLIMEKIIDDSFKIYFEFVEFIPSTNSGKPQIIKSYL